MTGMMNLYKHVGGRAPSRRRKADAPVMARKEEATSYGDDAATERTSDSLTETHAWYNSSRSAEFKLSLQPIFDILGRCGGELRRTTPNLPCIGSAPQH